MASRTAGALLAFASVALALPAFAQSNRAPVISGTPPAQAVARETYQFLPTASDPDRNRLTYSIRNKPAWASFSTSTGRLIGAPGVSHVGQASNIQISVTDGRLSASLPAFSITILPAGSTVGSSSGSATTSGSASGSGSSSGSTSGSGNLPPVISGTAPATAVPGSTYKFVPTARDPEGRRLTYSIRNKPVWAGFSSTTGKLVGVPGTSHLGRTFGDIVISVSDGALSAALPAFSIAVTRSGGGSTPPAGNRAPVVSGTPPRTATVGTPYSFTPGGSDPDGDALTWSITNKPGPASFSVSSGRLSWTPTSTASYSNIIITATDSRGAKTSLPAFPITVSAATPAPVTGSAALSWQAPTLYTNGTSLPSSGLSAFRIYRGSTASSLTRIAEVDSRTLQFNVQNLTRGTHYFAVTAVTTAGVESSLSAVGSKTIQ